jgi:response regulator RpfG family c-di-GMP phosphodiesterase
MSVPSEDGVMTRLPTVLVVDDELRSVEALQRILEEDFDVRTAVTVHDAEKILESEVVEVVLCDQRMPDMTGVEFLKSVRHGDTVRMIISGYTDAATCQRHQRCRHLPVLTKPGNLGSDPHHHECYSPVPPAA